MVGEFSFREPKGQGSIRCSADPRTGVDLDLPNSWLSDPAAQGTLGSELTQTTDGIEHLLNSPGADCDERERHR